MGRAITSVREHAVAGAAEHDQVMVAIVVEVLRGDPGTAERGWDREVGDVVARRCVAADASIEPVGGAVHDVDARVAPHPLLAQRMRR